MKIRVSMPEASVAIDFEEGKALEVFGKLNEVLLAMKKKERFLCRMKFSFRLRR